MIGSTTYTVSALHTEFMTELWKGSQKAGAGAGTGSGAAAALAGDRSLIIS